CERRPTGKSGGSGAHRDAVNQDVRTRVIGCPQAAEHGSGRVQSGQIERGLIIVGALGVIRSARVVRSNPRGQRIIADPWSDGKPSSRSADLNVRSSRRYASQNVVRIT